MGVMVTVSRIAIAFFRNFTFCIIPWFDLLWFFIFCMLYLGDFVVNKQISLSLANKISLTALTLSFTSVGPMLTEFKIFVNTLFTFKILSELDVKYSWYFLAISLSQCLT